MIKDYNSSSENKFTLKIEHFIDFTKINKKEVSSNTSISLENFNFYTLQEVKDCLYKEFPEKFKEPILHFDETKEFLPVQSKRKLKIKKNK